MKQSLEKILEVSASKRIKMTPRSTPKRLTAAEILEKFAGPSVDIYVGPHSKHFHLPRDILSHYSPFFERCFRGGSKAAEEQKLTLPVDRVEHFQHLIDYMFLNGGDPFEPRGDAKQQMKYCMDFVEYAGKYDLVPAIQILSGALKRLLAACFRAGVAEMSLQPHQIAVVFRVLPDGHELRTHVAMLGLKFGLVSGCFEVQEKDVDGFAGEMLKQLRKHKGQAGFQKVVSYYENIHHDFGAP